MQIAFKAIVRPGAGGENYRKLFVIASQNRALFAGCHHWRAAHQLFDAGAFFLKVSQLLAS